MTRECQENLHIAFVICSCRSYLGTDWNHIQFTLHENDPTTEFFVLHSIVIGLKRIES